MYYTKKKAKPRVIGGRKATDLDKDSRVTLQSEAIRFF
jgi:hypothetical protein